ncbi:MAG: type II toxin-antitoxin system Phd/YefM family antitoxin [bacterium]
MVNVISLKEMRPELPNVINCIDKRLDRYIITKRGKPVAIMMSVDDYEGLLETVEIFSDKRAVQRLRDAKIEIKEGKTIPLEELRQRIEQE